MMLVSSVAEVVGRDKRESTKVFAKYLAVIHVNYQSNSTPLYCSYIREFPHLEAGVNAVILRTYLY